MVRGQRIPHRVDRGRAYVESLRLQRQLVRDHRRANPRSVVALTVFLVEVIG